MRNAGGVTVQTDQRGFYTLYVPLEPAGARLPDGQASVKFSKSGFSTEVRTNIETWPNGDWIYNIRLKQGAGINTLDQRKQPRQTQRAGECENCPEETSPLQHRSNSLSVVLPASIRVGRNCTGTLCTTVHVFSLETYVKFVLPAEWFSCWGSIGTGGMNSLMAGAVAIRTYGLWHVYTPLNANYDICDNTSCQMVGSAQTSNGNIAADATARAILINAALNVVRSEYSAENNNKGCGDGWTGTGTSSPCIRDLVCQSQTPNGHGRGMCQWGTARWASGTRVLTSAPCAAGVAHGLGTRTWQQMLAHYYPAYSLTQGGTAAIQNATPNPATVARGSTFTIHYSVAATEAMPLLLGASIAPAGTTNYSSDPARDRTVNLLAGENSVSRQFTVPAAQATGLHDLFVALWYDANNNNTIDAGDFIVASRTESGALTVTPLTDVSPDQPAEFVLHQNHPNPFNPATEIRFSVGIYDAASPGGGHALLRVFDLLGREVATLFDGVAEPYNEYVVQFHGADLASGVYTYRLTSGGRVASKRFLMLK